MKLNRKLGIFATLVMVGVLAGCSVPQVVLEKVAGIAKKDLQRTSELATKYNKPDVAKCADFLLASLNAEDSTKAKLDELLKEDTSGLASAGLKAALLAELINGLNDPAKQSTFEESFKSNCSAVAGAIMLNILRDVRQVAAKGN